MLSTSPLSRLLGRWRPILELLLDLERTAPTELGLLVEGETGTGKKLVAEPFIY